MTLDSTSPVRPGFPAILSLSPFVRERLHFLRNQSSALSVSARHFRCVQHTSNKYGSTYLGLSSLEALIVSSVSLSTSPRSSSPLLLSFIVERSFYFAVFPLVGLSLWLATECYLDDRAKRAPDRGKLRKEPHHFVPSTLHAAAAAATARREARPPSRERKLK